MLNDSHSVQIGEYTISPEYDNGLLIVSFCTGSSLHNCGVMLHSIAINSKAEDKYDCVIMTSGLSDEDEWLLESTAEDMDNFSIRCVDLSDYFKMLSEKYDMPIHYNKFYPLALLTELFSEYERAIILSGTSIIRCDLSDMAGIELNGCLFAAPRDIKRDYRRLENVTEEQSEGMTVSEYEEKVLGISDGIYYNFRNCLLDLKALRSMGAGEKIISSVTEKGYTNPLYDALNVLAEGKVYPLGPEWNFPADEKLRFRIENSQQSELYDQFAAASKAAKIMEFTMEANPVADPAVAYAAAFYKYARSSPFYERIMIGINKHISRKVADKCIKTEMFRKSSKQRFKNFVNKMFPKGSRRRNFAKKILPYQSRRREVLSALFDRNKERLSVINHYLKMSFRVRFAMPLARFNPFSSAFRYRAKIKKFKDMYKGKRCFIVGLGPSLTIDDVEKLKGEITFSLNDVFQLFDKTDWRPTYYLCQELLSRMSPMLYDRLRENLTKNPMPQIFLPHCKYIRKLRKEFPLTEITSLPIEVDWCQYTKDNSGLPFSRKCEKIINNAHTTVYSIIQLAVYMGFSEIYLLGTDCNYQVGARHCYDSKLEFNFNNAKKCKMDSDGVLKGFIKAREAVDKIDGVTIYNATRGGMLEEFPRVDLDEVVGTKHSSNVMNISYSSSNEFCPYMGVSLYSLLCNNRHVDELNVYVLDLGIDDYNRRKLAAMVGSFHRKLTIIPAQDKLAELAEKHGLRPFNGSYATYAKLLTAELLPEADKILAMDADTIVDGDLFEWYSTDLTGRFLSAVPEITSRFRSSEDPEILNKNKFYCNAGMLLLNLQRFREDRFIEKMLTARETYGKELKLVDQTLVNLTCSSDDIVPAHFMYNYFLLSHDRSIRRKALRIYREYGWKMNHKGLKKDIRIYHFIGRRRPWISWKFCKYTGLWKKYWEKSPWADVPRISHLNGATRGKIKNNPKSYARIPVIGKTIVAITLLLERFTPGLWKGIMSIKNTLSPSKEKK